MNCFKTFIILFFIVLSTSSNVLAIPAEQRVTMDLPETVVKEFIAKSLPLEFKLQSGTMLGSISVDKISNLQLHRDKLSGYATLSGHRLNIVTDIGGQRLRMKIGTLTMSFQCEMTMRFDAKQQILYLRPVITELQSTDSAKTEIASSIALLINNRELPLRIDKFSPLLADTGGKKLNLSLQVADIRLQPDNLLLHIHPQLTVTPKKR